MSTPTRALFPPLIPLFPLFVLDDKFHGILLIQQVCSSTTTSSLTRSSHSHSLTVLEKKRKRRRRRRRREEEEKGRESRGDKRSVEMSDSDSEEEFFMSGLRGPLVLEEDEVQSCSAEPDAISPLQLLELSFLRRDTHGVRNLLEGESDGWSELQKRVAAMALSLLLGDYVSVIISSDTVAPFDHFCRQCLSVDSPSKVPDAIRTIAVNYIQSGQADEVAWRTFEVVLLGCAHFYLFCQANYTGPEISANDMHSLSIASGMKKENDVHVNDMEMASGLESTRSKCESQLGQQVAQYGVFQSKDDCDVDMSAFKSKFILQILESDGNYAFPLCELPLMLVLGRSLLLSASCPLRGSWQAGTSCFIILASFCIL